MSSTRFSSQPSVPAPADPLSLSPLLEEALALVRAHPFLLLGPLILLSLLTASDGQAAARPADVDAILADPWIWIPFFAIFGVIALAIVVVLFVAYVWAGLATTKAALALVDGAPAPTFGALLQDTRALLVRATGTALLAALFVVLGFIALVVPGFIVLTALVPLGAIMVSERTFGMAAARRAWELTRGRRWTLLAVLLVVALASIAATLAFTWIPIVGRALVAGVGGALQAYLAVVGVVFLRRAQAAAPQA